MSISTIYVPAEGDPNAKLWIIGEAPGYHEESERRPFIGESSKLLEAILGRAGISRAQVYITNLCHYRPPANKFDTLINSDALREGLSELQFLLQNHQPNCIASLGQWPLFYLTGKSGISKYRGSILAVHDDFIQLGRIQKVIPTYHPSFILRARSNEPIFDVDIRRIVSDSQFPELNLPKREYIINPPELEYWKEKIINAGFTAVDIESVKGTTHILCVGFSISPSVGVVIPYSDRLDVYDFINSILSNPLVEKCFHLGMYDTTVLKLNGFTINNYAHDTIVQAHVLSPELPRDLGYLVSVETREPYYKEEGRANIPGDVKGWSRKRNKDSLYIYNGKDVCCTHEIYLSQRKLLIESGLLDFYNYEMAVQRDCSIPFTDNGLLVDKDRLELFKYHVIKARAKNLLMLWKLADKKVNTGSNKQMCNLLYNDLKLPEKKKTNKKTGKSGRTADEDAIVSLLGYVSGRIATLKTDRVLKDWQIKLHILKLTLKIRAQDKLISAYLDIPFSDDQRARSLYKVFGTTTGRLATSKFVDGSGLNLATIPRDPLDIPDEDIKEWELQKK